MDLKHKTTLDILKYLAETQPECEAFVFASPGGEREALSWRTLFINSGRAARGFVNMGLKPGEYVVINMRNHPECLYAILGTMMAGAIPCCAKLYFRDGSDLLALMEQLKTCSMLLFDPCTYDHTWDVIQDLIGSISKDGSVSSLKMPYLRYVLCNEDGGTDKTHGLKTINQLIRENSHVDMFDISKLRDVPIVWQTSGSTGVPKLVLQSSGGPRMPTFNRKNRMYIDYAFISLSGNPLKTILEGVTRITPSIKTDHVPKEFTEDRLKIIRQERVNIMDTMSSVIHDMVSKQDQISEDWPLKLISTGAQPIQHNVTKVLGKLASVLILGYGTTETGVIASYTLTNKSQFIECFAGNILPGREVKVIDEIGNEVPKNTRGEVCVKSTDMFKCYVNDPITTAASFTTDGWYKTDDTGLITLDNKLLVFGRKGSRITTDEAYQVDPHVIESKLVSCEGVKDAIVVPVADAQYYQKMCACVIPETANGPTEENLRMQMEKIFIGRKSHSIFCPKYYIFLETFPKSEADKISRRELEALAATKFDEK